MANTLRNPYPPLKRGMNPLKFRQWVINNNNLYNNQRYSYPEEVANEIGEYVRGVDGKIHYITKIQSLESAPVIVNVPKESKPTSSSKPKTNSKVSLKPKAMPKKEKSNLVKLETTLKLLELFLPDEYGYVPGDSIDYETLLGNHWPPESDYDPEVANSNILDLLSFDAITLGATGGPKALTWLGTELLPRIPEYGKYIAPALRATAIPGMALLTPFTAVALQPVVNIVQDTTERPIVHDNYPYDSTKVPGKYDNGKIRPLTQEEWNNYLNSSIKKSLQDTIPIDTTKFQNLSSDQIGKMLEVLDPDKVYNPLSKTMEEKVDDSNFWKNLGKISLIALPPWEWPKPIRKAVNWFKKTDIKPLFPKLKEFWTTHPKLSRIGKGIGKIGGRVALADLLFDDFNIIPLPLFNGDPNVGNFEDLLEDIKKALNQMLIDRHKKWEKAKAVADSINSINKKTLGVKVTPDSIKRSSESLDSSNTTTNQPMPISDNNLGMRPDTIK